MSDLKYSFTCCAERYTTHCEAFGYKPCNVCADYELGLYEPHYPVPALNNLMPGLYYKLAEVELNPTFEYHYYKWCEELYAQLDYEAFYR